MKVLLINLKEPKTEGQKYSIIPPIGLWKIRSAIYKNNIHNSVHICDENLKQKTEDYLEKQKYDIIGISARFSVQHQEYQRVAGLCEGKAKVIAGGIHAINYGKVKGVDEIVNGPGENYFLSNKNAEEISLPWFFSDEIEEYWDENKPHDLISKTNRWMSIETSRGCNNYCHFCGIHSLWGKCWYPFSKRYIKNLLKYLNGEGIEELFIEDDNISIDKNRFIWLLKRFKERHFYWSCPNGIQIKHLLDNEVLKEISKTKCWRLSLPFETGSDETALKMRLFGKWVNYNTAWPLVQKLNDMGILTCGFFIIGYPGETKDDIKKTLEYANSLPLHQRNIYIATPYPGTDLYNLCVQKGYIKVDDSYYDNLLYTKGLINTEYITAEEVEKIKWEDREKAIERKRKEMNDSIVLDKCVKDLKRG